MHVLCTNNLSKNYGDTKALHNLTMSVQKGSIYGLVGKNGSGKTTLIRIICGLQNPSSGHYSLYENDYKDKDILNTRRRMGAIVETPSIFQNMTAKENLKQQYRVLGRPSFEDIDKLLDLVGLGSTGKKKAKNFSLGMKQRLGIAIALAGNPDFLVLDEPINGLDPQGIIDIRELILKLNRDYQITVLISSHILDELSRLATHYGFIDNGAIVKEVSAHEVEKDSKKCMRLKVDNIKGLIRGLDKKGISYTIISDYEADIFSVGNITEITMVLMDENCKIHSMTDCNESLESYYINLVGGNDNE